jgi:putative DNA primase/helicase
MGFEVDAPRALPQIDATVIPFPTNRHARHAMSVLQFLALVVPEGGNVAVCYTGQNGGLATRFFPRDKLDAAAGYIRWAVGQKMELWYGLASFREVHPDENKKGVLRGDRTQANAQMLRALWYDADLHRPGDNKKPGKAFADEAEFETWLAAFCAATGLPRPSLIVNSGYGRHVYWILEDALSRDDWQPLADALKAALIAHGAKGDIGLTGDSARILRPPETLNFKVPDDPKPVEVYHAGSEIPNALIERVLAPYMGVTTPHPSGNYNSNRNVAPLAGAPPALAQQHQSTLAAAAQDGISHRSYSFGRIATECEQVKQSLAVGGDGDARDLWYKGFLSLAHFCDDGAHYAHEISKGDKRYTAAEVDAELQQVAKEQAAKSFGAPLCKTFDESRPGVCQGCPHFREIETPYSLGVEKDATTVVVDEARPPNFSDEALALQFSAQHGDDARYVAKWGQWQLWTGSRWQTDDTMRAFDLARAICRSASAKLTDPKHINLASKIASAKTVAAVASLTRADRRHAATADQWDTDTMLLNTPGGIVDLRTGVVLPLDRHRYMTKSTTVAPGGDCPLWRRFLNDITAGDTDLQAFLQRIAGYSLTGDISEHALFFLYGTGRNGKGVFLNTLSAIAGDYAAVAPMSTFIASRHEQHPTDLAGLRGARLVTAQETEKGRRWAESKIKNLTGGDEVSARFMRQDFFTFNPQFKLVIAGNHKPGLRGVDEAIRGRFNLVPFTVKFTNNPDKNLFDKLKGERPGILKWAIDGCLEWQRVGLAPPPAVRDATNQYLAEEDTLAQWINECCDLGKPNTERSVGLFESWKAWAEKSGEFVGIQRDFTKALKERDGLTAYEESGTKRAMMRGIRLRPSAAPDAEDTPAAIAKRPVSGTTEGQQTLYEIWRRGEGKK